MRIAVDAMGGDNAPDAIVLGCLQALEEFDDIEISLFGMSEAIEAIVQNHNIADRSRLHIIDCKEVISSGEHPVHAIKSKKDSSLVRGLEETSAGKHDIFISAGNTGAVLAGGILIIRRMKGIKRPALAPLLPTKAGKGVLLIDCGANVDCRPEHLTQFALMGSAYMQKVMNVEKPAIGLVNNGAEAEKGNELTKACYELFEKLPIKFAGNCEAREALSGDFDVIVCDGFVGNVILKLTEGVAATLTSMLKEELQRDLRARIGALLAMPALKKFKSKMDYSEYGGAPLLGVSKGIIKAHGSSNAKAFQSAIRQARKFVDCQVIEVINQIAEQMD